MTALEIDPEVESAPKPARTQAQTEGEPAGAEVQTEGDPCTETSPILLGFGSMTIEESINDMKCRTKPAIEGLAVPRKRLHRYLELFKVNRVIVVEEKIEVVSRKLSRKWVHGSTESRK